MPSPAEHDAPDQGPGGWLILAFAIACGVTVANIYYAQPLVGPISESFGIDLSSAGVMLTMVMLGYVAGLIFLVPLGDLVENKTLILVTLGALIVSLLIAAAAPSAGIFIASTLLVGLTATGTQMIMPVVAHLAPAHQRGHIVGTVMSGLLFGILLSRPLATMVAGSFGWRAVFVMSAALMCGVLVLMAFALPRRKPEHSLNYATLIRSLGRLMLTTRVLQQRSAYQCLLYGSFSLFWTAMPLVLEEAPFSFGHIAMSAFLLSGAGGAFIAPYAGRLADRGRGDLVTVTAMTLVLVSFVVTWIGGHASGGTAIALFVIAGILIDAGTQGNVVAGQRAIYALAAETRSRFNALFLACAFFGGAVGSAFSGFAVARGGTTMIALIGIGTSLLALVLFGLEVASRKKA
ncbi:MFS transporter [Tardiphaga alba]|uniref:MFS transporter n=1 Tax=Tardiphaga alba TaxID=340268 RepID=A0ABX8A4Y7_9BRAD|nr:MFS transporter [Tardiphaga alba]QUS38477.1 MFS transporter [Tardiphaga alba]